MAQRQNLSLVLAENTWMMDGRIYTLHRHIDDGTYFASTYMTYIVYYLTYTKYPFMLLLL